ncbi:MAG: hypothetical protein NT045_08510 [Candidatus Aureabacteria bacterium]|nr:hypothetical protein [Candidatus Auribacterota bacterium]
MMHRCLRAICGVPCAALFYCPGGPGVHAADNASGNSSACTGHISSVDHVLQRVVIDPPPRGITVFAITRRETMIFRGARMLAFKELRPGLRVEVDYLAPGADGIAVATWIECNNKEK